MSKYHEEQMIQVCPMPIDKHEFFRLQIKSDDGRKTNWMNITPDQFRVIEMLLTKKQDK